jgi:hypothetical protein
VNAKALFSVNTVNSLSSVAKVLFFCIWGLTTIASAAAEIAEDHRAWQHGIDLVRVGDKLLLVWGSPGNPPRANPGGDWQHDIYYAWLNALNLTDTTVIEPRVLVARAEAQEPPSVAINSRGTILMTSEDGNGGINQHAGLWDSALGVLRPYPVMIRRGGHSGHVAALGERFLVAYGEGWVDHGGFLDLGTGKDIHARVVGNDGIPREEITIASGHRDGWPLVAASDRNWMVIWQPYPQRSLHAALINAAGRLESQRQISAGMPLRYAYDVEFSPQLSAYVVAGSADDGGFVALFNLHGEMVKIQRGLPPMVSESRVIISGDAAQTLAVYPVNPNGIAVVRLSSDAIELVKLIDHPYAWDYTGTTGVFTAPGSVLFATLSTTGLQLIAIELGTPLARH